MSIATKIMGILNVSPDSFYSASRQLDLQQAVAYAAKLADEGADVIDIGGESTRPGSEPVSAVEEMARVLPVIEAVSNKLSLPISIDTMKPEVAEAALDAGASWINDVTGFSDSRMRKIAADRQITICVMHMAGQPKTMQRNILYPRGVIIELLEWFERRIELLLRDGVKAENIVIDPGIGFGKTVADNLEILHNLPRFKAMGFPLLLGVSRKSMIGELLGGLPHERLAATLTINIVAMQAGVDYVRVHDVKEHKDAMTMLCHLIKKN